MMMFTPQQEAAQMFAAEHAAEVRTLDNLTTHNVPAGLAFEDDLDVLLNVTLQLYDAGNFKAAKASAQKVMDEAVIQKNMPMLTKGEYQFVIASDRLGSLTKAQVDRFRTHMHELDDHSKDGETYILQALIDLENKNVESVRQNLSLAKSHMAPGEKLNLNDDLLYIESKIVEETDIKKAVTLRQNLLLESPLGGRSVGNWTTADKQALIKRYFGFTEAIDQKSLTNPSDYALATVESLRDITDAHLKTDPNLALDICNFFINNEGKSALLSGKMADWAKSKLPSLKEYIQQKKIQEKKTKQEKYDTWLEGYKKMPWPNAYFSIDIYGSSSSEIGFKGGNLWFNRFDKPNSFLRLGGKLGEEVPVSGDILCVSSIGNPIAKDRQFLGDFYLMSMRPVKPVDGYDMATLSTSKLIGRWKPKSGFYLDAGLMFQSLDPSIYDMGYSYAEDGTIDFADERNDSELMRQFIQEFHDHYKLRSFNGTNQLEYMTSSAVSSLSFEIGGGLHSVLVNPESGMMLDYMGLAIINRNWTNSYDIEIDPDEGDRMDFFPGRDKGTPELKSTELWLKGEMSLFQNMNWNVGVLLEQKLYSDQELKGLPSMQQLFEAGNYNGKYGLDVTYAVGEFKFQKNFWAFNACVMMTLDGLNKLHPEIMGGISYYINKE